MYKYGLAGAQKIVQGPNILGKNSTPLPQYTPVRVKDIILDNSHPLFKELGEWNSIGTIFYDKSMDPSPAPSKDLPVAFPLFPNIKNYPLKNELVFIISLPGLAIDKITDNNVSYYITPLNIWNSQHHNAFPDNIFENLQPLSQQKDNNQIINGSPKRVDDKDLTIDLGKTFKEKSNINPLLPFEGDHILEGRWGNSIRLGSTVKNSPIKNEWSSFGENGDPIIILRNGQGIEKNNGWENILESVNKDLSSIYFCSSQKIPINVSSKRYDSFKNNKPIDPLEYSKNQIIINSGRILFNSSKDNILLSSAKSISLSSIQSVNIDTNIFVTSAQKNYIGSPNATEPMILGDKTVTLLKQLVSNLSEFMQICSKLQYGPAGTPIAPLNLISNEITLILDNINNNLDSIKSKNNFTI
jgi:hypothetical protein